MDENYMSDTTSRHSSVTDTAVTANDSEELSKYYTVDATSSFSVADKENAEVTNSSF